MKLGNNMFPNVDVQARIEPPPIPLIGAATEKVKGFNTIKINMLRGLASATSETYTLKIPTFKNVKPEEFLQMVKDFKTATDVTGTMSTTGKIQFLGTILRREALGEFDVLAGQVGSTTNGDFKLIKEVLPSFFFINALNKQNCAIRRATRKPRDLLLKIFAAQLTELHNYLPFFPGSSAANKIDPE